MPYLLFAGNRYYPLGGVEDFRGGYATLAEAQAAATVLDPETGQARPRHDWAHVAVYDGERLTIVWAEPA